MRERSGDWRPFVVLLVALFGVAGGSIFVRLANAPALAFAAWRLGLATLVVVPVAALRPRQISGSRRARLWALCSGLLLALHFATWIESLAHISVSASVVLVTTAPVWVVAIAWLFGLQRPTAGELLAIALSVGGSAIIGGASFGAGGTSLRGALLALAGAVCMGAFLLLSRRCQQELEFLDFVSRAYGGAAIGLWLAVLATGTPFVGFDTRTWLAFAAAAALSQLVGHGGYNWSLRHLEPAFVAVVLVGEPVLASALAWWLFGETIAPATWVGGALILLGVCVGFAHARRTGD
jgi:drug/metabolite transporter (DMT)-like permease